MSTEPRRITKRDALAIHEASLARFGGLPGLRDEGLLESALAQPFQSFGGEELYATFAEKAARLAYGIAKNHPFLDGNKRTATACMGAFLRLNGFRFKPRADELLSTMLGVAGGTIGYEEFVGWVSRNFQPRSENGMRCLASRCPSHANQKLQPLGTNAVAALELLWTHTTLDQEED